MEKGVKMVHPALWVHKAMLDSEGLPENAGQMEKRAQRALEVRMDSQDPRVLLGQWDHLDLLDFQVFQVLRDIKVFPVRKADRVSKVQLG